MNTVLYFTGYRELFQNRKNKNYEIKKETNLDKLKAISEITDEALKEFSKKLFYKTNWKIVR